MLKIGECSKLAQVPALTERYYDQVGLLKPVAMDRCSGYRFYSAGQLPGLHRILALKEPGFSLEQMRGMLRLRLRRLVPARGGCGTATIVRLCRVHTIAAGLQVLWERYRKRDSVDHISGFEPSFCFTSSVAAARASIVSGRRRSAPASTFSWICSGVRAPARTEITPG